jgi:prepilin-type N-terminal cleavage/methylation domain-containing protein
VKQRKLVKFRIRRKVDGGFTIVESLLAIIIVGILLLGIAPVIAISVATRVQARRVENATQAARTYIEGTRATSIQAPNSRAYLSKTSSNDLFSTMPAPDSSALSICLTKTTSTKCPTNNYIDPQPLPPAVAKSYGGNALDGVTSSLYCFDVDGDGVCSADSTQDMIVQAFRSTTLKDATSDSGTISADANLGYILGVRVYRSSAFDGGAVLNASSTSTDGTNQRAATFTGGLGDKKAPLVEMVTDITIRGNDPNKLFSNICTRLGGSKNNDNISCPTVSPSP